MPEPDPTPAPAAAAALETTDGAGRGRRLAIMCGLIAAGMLAVAWVRWHSFSEPIEGDEAIYLIIAQDWREGGALYQSLWDNKPVGTFLIYRLLIAVWGCSEVAARAGAMVAALATVPVVALSLRQRPLWLTALITVVVWPLLNGIPSTHVNASNMEVFLLPLLLAAFVLSQWAAERRSLALVYGTVAVVAVAFSVKQVPLPYFAMPYAVWLAARPADWRRLLPHVAGGALLSVVVLLAVYAIAGFSPAAAVAQQLDTLSAIDSQAAPAWRRMPVDIAIMPWQPSIRALLPLTLLAGAGILWQLAARRRPVDWALLVFAVLSVLATYLPGKHDHYHILLLPLFAFGFGAFVEALAGRQRLAAAAVALALVGWLGHIAWTTYFSRTPIEISTAKYGSPWFPYDRRIGQHLAEIGITGETVFIAGTHPSIYVYSGNRPATRFFNAYNTRQGVVDQAGYAAQVLDAPPPWIILLNPSDLPGLQELLDTRYTLIGPLAAHYGASIYRRHE